MSGWIMLIAIVGISTYNFLLGRQWSRLDHNPWTGRPLGGFFSTPHPGVVPARLSVDQIRRRGRIMMIMAPFICVFGAVIAFGLFGPMKHLTPIKF
ncbi:MAG: hypothetical protein JST65_01165 [Acidobacteria bacterium]|nr:hypothetical protein [Acidobacteriota bacterium]